jgi:hypothetical protein
MLESERWLELGGIPLSPKLLLLYQIPLFALLAQLGLTQPVAASALKGILVDPVPH